MKSFNFYFNLINGYYGDRAAVRSNVPYMAHIIEGVEILKCINGTDAAIAAYMIHPMFQDNDKLSENLKKYSHDIDGYVLNLALEYRDVANDYLSFRKIKNLSEIRLSQTKEVNDMLIADKVQNYKDFLLYHADSHKNSKELDQYFQNWFDRLDVNYKNLHSLCYTSNSLNETNLNGE